MGDKLTSRGHRHGEAFCLMTYECAGTTRGGETIAGVRHLHQSQGCGHRETYWNSRDGVTPFGANCPSCGSTLQHVNWRADRYAPDHQPHFGQGVWRDGTPDEAEAVMRKRIESCRGTPYECSKEEAEELIAAARSGDPDRCSEFQQGWPMFYRAGREG